MSYPRIAVLCTALASASCAHAGHEVYRGDYRGPRGAFVDYARVIDVEPIVRTVRVSAPERECWDEEVVVREDRGYRSATPMILGGIIGGVLGNQVGKGRGRDIATVAGTVLGGSVGRDIGRGRADGGYYTSTETRCEQVDRYHTEERIDGYRVTYLYQGEEYTTRTAEHPGERIRVKVSVAPAE